MVAHDAKSGRSVAEGARHAVQILDCTLRDASYPIKFQFSAEDAALIASALEQAGVRLVEIGHGLGIGASSEKHGFAAASDEEYLDVVRSVLGTASFGVFLIPGIATLEQLRTVARYGAGFVRVGTDVARTDDGEPFIKLAKELGMQVSANLMKTYAVSADEVLTRAERLCQWEVDTISIVDSAGGMLPSDVASYVSPLVRAVDAKIGFHGHNNLQLAIANAVAAADAGATVLDSTLRGLGRSAGNAQTEVLALVLSRLGYDTGIDAFKIMDAGDRLIAPMARGRGVDSLEMTLGYALFHSSYFPIVERVAAKYGVDPRRLAVQVSDIDRVNVTEDLVCVAAERLIKEPSNLVTGLSSDSRVIKQMEMLEDKKGSGVQDTARAIATQLLGIAAKTGRTSIFTISRTPKMGLSPGVKFPFVRMNEAFVVGNAEVSTTDEGSQISRMLDGSVDFILVDIDRGVSKTARLLDRVREATKRSIVLTYHDEDAHLLSAEALVTQLVSPTQDFTICVCGMECFGQQLATTLIKDGYRLVLWDANESRLSGALSSVQSNAGSGIEVLPVSRLRIGEARLDVLIGAAIREQILDLELISCVKDGGMVIDAGVGTLTEEAVRQCQARQLPAYRVDLRAGVFAQATAAVATYRLMHRDQGRSTIAGSSVVAGGIVGLRGSIVVDSISDPTKVIGVADGTGSILREEDAISYRHIIRSVEREILKRRTG